MAECAVCKGGHPEWQVVVPVHRRLHACKDHISNVLADVARGIPVTVRAINNKEE